MNPTGVEADVVALLVILGISENLRVVLPLGVLGLGVELAHKDCFGYRFKPNILCLKESTKRYKKIEIIPHILSDQHGLSELKQYQKQQNTYKVFET